MCVITIAHIFSCRHIEAVFTVSRCPDATRRQIPYCNRDCIPALLKGKLISTPCSFCRPGEPITDIRDERIVDSWLMCRHLTRFLQSGLCRFLDDRELGVYAIMRALEATRLELELRLDQLLPDDSAEHRRQRKVLVDFVHDNPMEIEVFTLESCLDSEQCLCGGTPSADHGR
jgi:hypothetical protein